MYDQLIECVPNFSEGRDPTVIKQITDQIETVDGVQLLDVDPGQATNRTVVTFVGPPEPVIEAAFRAAKKASELIDMSKHRGEHPRFGATDVCPLVPDANITMEQTVVYARRLAERIGKELGIRTAGEVRQIVVRLERKGFVRREGDGRERRIRLERV